MSSAAVTLDFSKAQPLSSPVNLDFSKAQPINPSPGNTVKVGGTPLNLETGEGAPTYDPTTQQQMEQAHGAVSLMGRPAGSIAQEKAVDDAISSPVPSAENAPEGSKAVAEAGEDIPILAASAASIPAAGAAIEGIAGKVASAIPSAKRAGQAFQAVKEVAGDMPVDVSRAGKAALEFKQIADAGGSNSKVINNFIARATDPKKPPLTYNEARLFYSNASRLSAEEVSRLNPQMRRAMSTFTQSLGQDIEQTAAHAGKLEELQGAMKEYRKSKVLEDRFEDAKKMAINAIKVGIPSTAALWAAKKLIWGE